MQRDCQWWSLTGQRAAGLLLQQQSQVWMCPSLHAWTPESRGLWHGLGPVGPGAHQEGNRNSRCLPAPGSGVARGGPRGGRSLLGAQGLSSKKHAPAAVQCLAILPWHVPAEPRDPCPSPGCWPWSPGHSAAALCRPASPAGPDPLWALVSGVSAGRAEARAGVLRLLWTVAETETVPSQGSRQRPRELLLPLPTPRLQAPLAAGHRARCPLRPPSLSLCLSSEPLIRTRVAGWPELSGVGCRAGSCCSMWTTSVAKSRPGV